MLRAVLASQHISSVAATRLDMFSLLAHRENQLSSPKGQEHHPATSQRHPAPVFYCVQGKAKPLQKPASRKCGRYLPTMSVQPVTFVSSALLLISFLARPSVQFTASTAALLSLGGSLHSSFMKSGNICQLCFLTVLKLLPRWTWRAFILARGIPNQVKPLHHEGAS